MDPIAKIFFYYNNESRESTHYVLIEFILHHIKELSTLSITEFADRTYVSKTTVSRFINFLGFDSYREFKKYFSSISRFSKNIFLRMSIAESQEIATDPEKFFVQYSDQVIDSIQDMQNTLDIQQVDELIHRVIRAQRVACLGYSDAQYIAKDIQLGCLTAGKVIDVAETQVKLDEILSMYSKEDLIIILSNYGNFFSHHKQSFRELLVKDIPLVLVTQNYNSMDSFSFDQTIYLTSNRHLNIGNYPMRIFSEYFVRRLMHISN
ncbi:MurR/RpiR family transcriptional regulator [Vagococcus elongatus]|uniref:HTH rpiR-type domain-containing protein n=1 Tax=Vagococcus elongatus TaxID=180344 RepID=A0A430ALF1_9ENTE|nr:MurR/RpiR family transcriptional regulator [Vagococcus elongatus]RSU08925.1 hypothetical protein CBF29_12755 [Vagococcus elongatus]